MGQQPAGTTRIISRSYASLGMASVPLEDAAPATLGLTRRRDTEDRLAADFIKLAQEVFATTPRALSTRDDRLTGEQGSTRRDEKPASTNSEEHSRRAARSHKRNSGPRTTGTRC